MLNQSRNMFHTLQNSVENHFPSSPLRTVGIYKLHMLILLQWALQNRCCLDYDHSWICGQFDYPFGTSPVRRFNLGNLGVLFIEFPARSDPEHVIDCLFFRHFLLQLNLFVHPLLRRRNSGVADLGSNRLTVAISHQASTVTPRRRGPRGERLLIEIHNAAGYRLMNHQNIGKLGFYYY